MPSSMLISRSLTLYQSLHWKGSRLTLSSFVQFPSLIEKTTNNRWRNILWCLLSNILYFSLVIKYFNKKFQPFYNGHHQCMKIYQWSKTMSTINVSMTETHFHDISYSTQQDLLAKFWTGSNKPESLLNAGPLNLICHDC